MSGFACGHACGHACVLVLGHKGVGGILGEEEKHSWDEYVGCDDVAIYKKIPYSVQL